LKTANPPLSTPQNRHQRTDRRRFGAISKIVISATKINQNRYLQPGVCLCVCYLGVVALRSTCGRDER